MKVSRSIYFFILATIAISCEKDEFSKGEGLLFPSFSGQWPVTANFGKFKNTVYLGFDHYDDSTGLIYRIRLDYIPSIEDSIQLEHITNIPGQDERKPTANFYVMTDEDAITDEYEIDSLSIEKSYLKLECITNRKISGNFRIFLRLVKRNHVPKYAPFIPDSFSVVNAKFNAEEF